MKKTVFVTCLVFLLLSAINQAKSTEEPLDQIAAFVNDDIVTTSELDRSLALMKTQMPQEQASLPSKKTLRKQALKQLVDNKIQMQIAKQVGIIIADAEIDRFVQRVADRNNITVDQLYQHLNHDGIATADYRHLLREQMTIQKLQQQEVGGHLTVSPEEIDHFMHSKLWREHTNQEYHLENILVPFSGTPSSDEIVAAKKQADAILDKIHQGKHFHEIRQQDSGENHSLEGGDLGWRKLPEIPSAFSQYVVSMKPNDVAGPIQTPNGFHLIRLIGSRTADETDAAPDRQQVEQLLLQRKFEEQVQNWLSRMRGQAFISLNTAKQNTP